MILLLFVSWYLLWAGAVLLFFPFATLIHELGHAFAVLLLTPYQARMHIGHGPLVWYGRFGRLEIRFHRAANAKRSLMWDVLNACVGLVLFPTTPSQRWRPTLVALAGPVASLLLSSVCVFLMRVVGFATPWTFPAAGFCALGAAVAGLQVLMNLFPWRVHPRGKRSDGLLIVHALFTPQNVGSKGAGSIYSDAAAQALSSAKAMAHQAGHAYVATEHLLLALLDDASGQAQAAVAALGDVERACELAGTPGTVEPEGPGTLTVPAKAAIETAAQAAHALGHERIGSLTLLLGLATCGAGNAATALATCGVTPDALQQFVHHAPPIEGWSPALYRSDSANGARLKLRSALIIATLIAALGFVDGGAHVILSGMGLALIPMLLWALMQVRRGARRRVYAALITAGALAVALIAISLALCVRVEIALLHAGGEAALLHDRSFLTLAGYGSLGVAMLLLLGSTAAIARRREATR